MILTCKNIVGSHSVSIIQTIPKILSDGVILFSFSIGRELMILLRFFLSFVMALRLGAVAAGFHRAPAAAAIAARVYKEIAAAAIVGAFADAIQPLRRQ